MGYNVGDLSNASHATILGVRVLRFFFHHPKWGSNNRNKALLDASRMGYRWPYPVTRWDGHDDLKRLSARSTWQFSFQFSFGSNHWGP